MKSLNLLFSTGHLLNKDHEWKKPTKISLRALGNRDERRLIPFYFGFPSEMGLAVSSR